MIAIYFLFIHNLKIKFFNELQCHVQILSIKKTTIILPSGKYYVYIFLNIVFIFSYYNYFLLKTKCISFFLLHIMKKSVKLNDKL